MKRKMKKGKRWFAAILALALMLPAATAMAAPEQVTVSGRSMMHFVVDGVEYAPPEDQSGFFYDGGKYTYVPLRFVAHILGKDVSWDNAAKRVTISEPKNDEVRAEIEAYKKAQKVADSVIEAAGPVTWETLPIEVVPNVKYVIFGNEVQPAAETPGLMVNNRIFVPLRFVSENLGYQVGWDKTTLTIAIQVAEVDRIVNKYREMAEQIKGDTIDEAMAILKDLGLNAADVLMGRASEEQMAELRKVAAEWLPGLEQRLNDFIAEMKKELTDAEQPTLQADLLRKELENLLKTAKNILEVGGADS